LVIQPENGMISDDRVTSDRERRREWFQS
jgi:hypothetical protein